MPIYCDESGGVGRGVMTLAALTIEAEAADEVLTGFRAQTGLTGELKGSRIDLDQRALLFGLLERQQWTATVGVAISALVPLLNEDRGDHDIEVYAALFDDVLGSVLPKAGTCAQVILDDGRYGPETLRLVREDIAQLVGPWGLATLELSHRASGLQLADVIANSFFNRALVTSRQGRMAAAVARFLKSGQIEMRILGDVHPD